MGDLVTSRPVERQCTGKRAYIFKVDAERVARIRVGKGAPPLRVYQCTHCPFWHLTKQPREV
jgi:hypothetical protein